MKRSVLGYAALAVLLVCLLLAVHLLRSESPGKRPIRVTQGFYVGRGTTSQGGNVSLEVRTGIRTLFLQILPGQGCTGLPAVLQRMFSPEIPIDETGRFRRELDLGPARYVLGGAFDGKDGVSGEVEFAGKGCRIAFTATLAPAAADSDRDGVPDGVDPDVVPAGCGDRVAEPPEECDDGNRVEFDDCKNDCTANVCGDGVRRLGVEACDEGEKNSNAPNAGCRKDCSERRCGDGIVDDASGEECDDGNAVSNDGCSAECKVEKKEQCGDGVVEPPEQCDDGGERSNAPNARCRLDCSERRCGDGIVDDAFGEECDDGNAIAGDGCDDRCRNEGSEEGAYGKKGRTLFD